MTSIGCWLIFVIFIDSYSVNGQCTIKQNGLDDPEHCHNIESQICDLLLYELKSQSGVNKCHCSQTELQDQQPQNTTCIFEETGRFSTKLDRLEEQIARHDQQLKTLNEQLLNMLDALNRTFKLGLDQYADTQTHLQTLDQSLQSHAETMTRALQLHHQNLSTRFERNDERLEDLGRSVRESEGLIKEIHQAVVAARDCADIRMAGQRDSGVYRVYPGNIVKHVEISVYCNMSLAEGQGWLVFQRREDGSENFERTWIEYANGFGNLTGEFWIGNDILHLLTSNRNYKLRIELEDFSGEKRYAEYGKFYVGPLSDKYRLTVGNYSGNAGDSLSDHNGYQFSTKDADHDEDQHSCAQAFRGAWWYHQCHSSNLNGAYLRGNHSTYADGIEWHSFRGHYYSLKTVEMKITAID